MNRINLLARTPRFPTRLLQMRRSWGIWHVLAEGKGAYPGSTLPDLCQQDLVEVEVVRVFFSLLNLDWQEKIFVKLVSWTSDSFFTWYEYSRVSFFSVSVWFLSFHHVVCPENWALWRVRLFSLWPPPPCSLSGHDKFSRQFSVYSVPLRDGLLSPPVEGCLCKWWAAK